MAMIDENGRKVEEKEMEAGKVREPVLLQIHFLVTPLSLD